MSKSTKQNDGKPKPHDATIDAGERDFRLTREEAKGGSPADASVGGEEDAGVGLEFLVRKDEVGDLAKHLQRDEDKVRDKKAKAQQHEPPKE